MVLLYMLNSFSHWTQCVFHSLLCVLSGFKVMLLLLLDNPFKHTPRNKDVETPCIPEYARHNQTSFQATFTNIIKMTSSPSLLVSTHQRWYKKKNIKNKAQKWSKGFAYLASTISFSLTADTVMWLVRSVEEQWVFQLSQMLGCQMWAVLIFSLGGDVVNSVLSREHRKPFFFSLSSKQKQALFSETGLLWPI